MIAALALAVCVEAVYYPLTMSGPVCSTEREMVECGCSECMTWGQVDDAMAYEVERVTVSNGTRIIVGRLDVQYIDNDGLGDVTAVHPVVWCFTEDTSNDPDRFPREGTLYEYRVRACKIADNCGDWSNIVDYRAAPYACYDAGREQQCYVGDGVISR